MEPAVCHISGTAAGPDNGIVRVEARIGDCIRVNGSRVSACVGSVVDCLDQQPQTQEFSVRKFKIDRMPEGTTCAQVVASSFD